MKTLFIEKSKRFLFGIWSNVKEVNRRYQKPRIKMTRKVAVALFMLRLYLFLLIALMFVKFISIVSGH